MHCGSLDQDQDHDEEEHSAEPAQPVDEGPENMLNCCLETFTSDCRMRPRPCRTFFWQSHLDALVETRMRARHQSMALERRPEPPWGLEKKLRQEKDASTNTQITDTA